MSDWEITGWIMLAMPFVAGAVLGARYFIRSTIDAWRHGDRFPAYLFGGIVWFGAAMLMVSYGQGHLRLP